VEQRNVPGEVEHVAVDTRFEADTQFVAGHRFIVHQDVEIVDQAEVLFRRLGG
jgi:hypothetical protein